MGGTQQCQSGPSLRIRCELLHWSSPEKGFSPIAINPVLAGARHPGVQNAQHFHTAGLRFPYNNMFYVLEAGGNEFYEKRDPRSGRLL